MAATQGSAAYAQWVEEWEMRGFKAYLITFMFNQLAGSSIQIQDEMLRIVEKIYSIYLPRVVRRPLAASARDHHPLWIVSPDLPVFKYLKQQLRDVIVNGGLHVQGFALEPETRRMADLIDELFFARRDLFCRLCPEIQAIRLDPVTHSKERVSEYLFKAIHAGRIGDDKVLILPRTIPELRHVQDLRIGRQSSIFSYATKHGRQD